MFDPRRIQFVKNVQNLSEFNGSMRKAVLAAGYSQSVADTPKLLTDRNWFKNALPDEKETSTAISELLHAAKVEHYVFPSEVSDEDIREIVESIAGCRLQKIRHLKEQTYAWYHIPDNRSKKEAIDIILKVKGHYAAEKLEVTNAEATKTTEELLAELEEIKRIKSQGQVNNG